MTVKTSVAAVTIGLLAISPAFAQTTVVPSPGSKQVIPEKQGTPMQDGRSESLSKKLSNSGGVIKPRGDVDPGIKVPVPDAQLHTMPVIPPAATGGDSAK